MLHPNSLQQERVTVREFSSAPELSLDFLPLQVREGMDNVIRSSRIQKLGLGLAGFPGYIHPDRVQVLGGSEINYLNILDPAARSAAFEHLRGQRICCVIVTKGLDLPEGFLELALSEKIPVLQTAALSSIAISRITSYLERRLAPHETIHGVLIEVFGLGILLLGPSGIGKSECALELVLRGHRLIADDSVQITRRGIDRLVGSGSEVLQYHMELRGLGIINVKDLFGISATGSSQSVDFAVRLERWNPDTEYDRLGLNGSAVEFLGVEIPIIEMPVAPGRNVSTLVEVAARIHLLRKRGYQPSKELLESLVREADNRDAR
jgi:HPr kinase/phosphorylase